jgi:hypothetical protein
MKIYSAQRFPVRRSGHLPEKIVTLILLTLIASAFCGMAFAGNNEGDPGVQPIDGSDLAAQMGIHFVTGSSSKILLDRDGKQYELDLTTHQLRLLPASEQANSTASDSAATAPNTSSTNSNSQQEKKTARPQFYRPGDDFVFTLPSGRPIDRHAWSINFTHRFPYEAAFTGPARGATLFGLDDFAIPSFGLQYGVTSHLSVSVYRSPSIIGRPIELGARYNFLSERHGPFNAAGRFSIDGQNNFSRNFTTNFELEVSRSIGRRAQLYAIPTLSLHNRPVIALSSASLEEPFPYQPCSQSLANGVSPALQLHACENTFSIGAGAAVDIRPTVALVAEIIPTIANGEELGIHRPPFSFGIQKKIYHHAFTFGFTTAPGTTTSQRIATRSVFLQDPHADTPGGLFAGFDILRQIP